MLKKPKGRRQLQDASRTRAPEHTMMVVSDVVARLTEASEQGEEVDVRRLLMDSARRHGASGTPRLIDVLAAVPPDRRTRLLPYVRAKPIRTASGICIVALMCKPHRCPHQERCGSACQYCPGGPDSDFEYSTQSYTGYEPTSMRAIRARYHPFAQIRARLAQLARLGHGVDKVEVVVMGGTFLSLPVSYQQWFACNIHDSLSGHVSATVPEALRYSEVSSSKCVGITIETRPDYCLNPQLDLCLRYGATRLEVGVQTLYSDVLQSVNRGHDLQTTVMCFAQARDHGFKFCAHMMPDLPEVGVERDVECFRELFEDPRFRPDGLKLYPTLVIRGTGLYELWKRGLFRSYPYDTLVALTARILAMVPPWTRVYRVQRDIPLPLVTSGVDFGNLRETALAHLRKLGLRTGDVRTREVGVQETHFKVRPDRVELMRRDYAASDGWETFLSYEDPVQDILIGLLRLRRPSRSAMCCEIRSPDFGGASSAVPAGEPLRVSIVRELHVYGMAVPVHARDPAQFQHRGFGTMLMHEAERIAREEHGSLKMAVIAGVGTRQYYRKLGYELDGPFMSKNLTSSPLTGRRAAAEGAGWHGESLASGTQPHLPFGRAAPVSYR